MWPTRKLPIFYTLQSLLKIFTFPCKEILSQGASLNTWYFLLPISVVKEFTSISVKTDNDFL